MEKDEVSFGINYPATFRYTHRQGLVIACLGPHYTSMHKSDPYLCIREVTQMICLNEDYLQELKYLVLL